MGCRVYYAVRTGRKPGIYPTWEACKAQVSGFSNARFKKFPTRELAEQYINVDKPAPLRSCYSGVILPWDYPTFITCLDGDGSDA